MPTETAIGRLGRPGTGSLDDKAVRHGRTRSNSLLVILAVGLLLFCAAAGALSYVVGPVKLRIAVGPAGSDDQRVIQAMSEVFAFESRSVRLSPITTDGSAEAVALLGAGKVDLAVGRGDLTMPADTQSLAVLRKNFAVLWSATGRAPAPGTE